MNLTLLPILAGMALGAALISIARLFIPARTSIDDTLQRLYLNPNLEATYRPTGGSGIERFGQRIQSRIRFLRSSASLKDLEALDMSPARLYATKAIFALAGLSFGVLMALTTWLMGAPIFILPGFVSLIAAVVGWIIPDLTTKSAAAHKREQFTRTITSYYDLVTLMRLSGASVMDSINVPADIADAPLFVRIRITLARQRLEHRRPWDGLIGLGEDLGLPELRDLGILMSMSGERGSPAAGVLTSKARDIRNEVLAQDIRDSQRDLHRQTVLVAGLCGILTLFMMVPILLRMASS